MDYIHYEKYDNDIIGIFRRINITSLAIGWGPRILTKIVIYIYISSKVPTFLYIIGPPKMNDSNSRVIFVWSLGSQYYWEGKTVTVLLNKWLAPTAGLDSTSRQQPRRQVRSGRHVKYAMAAMDADVPTCRIEFSRVKCVAF